MPTDAPGIEPPPPPAVPTTAAIPATTTVVQRRAPSRTALIIGGGVAVAALGVLLALLVRPDPSVADGEASVAQMAIEVDKPRFDPPPPVTGQMEVLPADMAQAARPVPAPYTLPADAAPPVDQAQEPHAQPAPAPQRTASFDCASAQSGAEQMICSDPALAAADRALARAYRRALQVTDAPDQLRDEQRDFLDIREDAARRSPAALAGVLRQRTEDLMTVADEQ